MDYFYVFFFYLSNFFIKTHIRKILTGTVNIFQKKYHIELEKNYKASDAHEKHRKSYGARVQVYAFPTHLLCETMT